MGKYSLVYKAKDNVYPDVCSCSLMRFIVETWGNNYLFIIQTNAFSFILKLCLLYPWTSLKCEPIEDLRKVKISYIKKGYNLNLQRYGLTQFGYQSTQKINTSISKIPKWGYDTYYIGPSDTYWKFPK